MSLALKIVLAVVSVILTISILLQSSNSAGLSGSIGGGAEQLFGKRKARDTKVCSAKSQQLQPFYLSCCHWYLLRWNKKSGCDAHTNVNLVL